MSQDLETLLQHRADVLRQLSEIGDLRQGSLTAQFRKCGKPGCHCAKGPGHGPYLQLTRKVNGKTRCSPAAAEDQTRVQIEEYKRLRELVQQLIEVSDRICDARLDRSRGDEVKKSLRGHCRGGSIVRNKPPDRGRGRHRHGGCRNRSEADDDGDRSPCRRQAVQRRSFRSRWTFNRMHVMWRRGPRAGARKPSQRRWAKFDWNELTTTATSATPGSARGTGRSGWKKPRFPPLPYAWSGLRPPNVASQQPVA